MPNAASTTGNCKTNLYANSTHTLSHTPVAGLRSQLHAGSRSQIVRFFCGDLGLSSQIALLQPAILCLSHPIPIVTSKHLSLNQHSQILDVQISILKFVPRTESFIIPPFPRFYAVSLVIVISASHKHLNSFSASCL